MRPLMMNSAGFGGDGIEEDAEVFGAVVGASWLEGDVTSALGLHPTSIANVSRLK